MPPGRTPITTKVVGPNPLDQAAAWKRLRDEVEAGHQAYVVCPLVEDKGKVEAKAATEEFERLQAEELAGLRLGLLHGQLPSKEKEAVMAAFRARRARRARRDDRDRGRRRRAERDRDDRRGRRPLRPLAAPPAARPRRARRRRSRGASSFADPTTPDGEERMAAMAASTDGFLLAEKDLEIRGAGEVFGERQSGFSDLKLGRIPRDEAIVIEARAASPRRSSTPIPSSPRTPSCAKRSRISSATTSSSSSRADGAARDAPRRAGDRGQRRAAAGSVAPPGDDVRPTKDMVREAVFSALDARGAIVDARCSTCTRAPARSASRRCRAARRGPCSSSATGARSRPIDDEPRAHRLRRARRGSCGPTWRAFLAAPPPPRSAVRPRARRPAVRRRATTTVDGARRRARRARAGSHQTRSSCIERPVGAGGHRRRKRSEPLGADVRRYARRLPRAPDLRDLTGEPAWRPPSARAPSTR